jgi:hypothetical protein
MSSPALGAGASIDEATVEQKTQAGLAYKEAKAALDAGRKEEALVGFRKSYDIVASPNSLFMVVRTLQDLGRLAEAYRTNQEAIEVAEKAAAASPKYKETAVAARDKDKELTALIGLLTVTVSAPPGWTLSVNGMEVSEDAVSRPIAVDPGTATVELTTPQGNETKQIEVAAGASASLTIAPMTPVTPEPSSDQGAEEEADDGEGPDGLLVTSVVALGIGGAGMILFGVFGGLTLSEYSALEDECGGGACSAADSAKGDDGRTFQTVANVSLIVGAVGLAAGTGLLIAALAQDDDGADTASTTPTLAVGPGSVVLSGSF